MTSIKNSGIRLGTYRMIEWEYQKMIGFACGYERFSIGQWIRK